MQSAGDTAANRRDYNMETISYNGPRGEHRVTVAAMDMAIYRYLPASPRTLWETLAERTGEHVDTFRPMNITECLVVLADFEYNTDVYVGGPFSTDKGNTP